MYNIYLWKHLGTRQTVFAFDPVANRNVAIKIALSLLLPPYSNQLERLFIPLTIEILIQNLFESRPRG